MTQFFSEVTGEPMVVTRRSTPYAAVLATALALTACSGGDADPTQTVGPTGVAASSAPTPSASITTATRTTAEDPVLAKIPKAARAETPQGAEAFVRFYFDQLNAAFREADPELVEGLSTKKCIMCSAMLGGVKDVRAKHQRYDSDLITVTTATVMDFVSSNRRVLAQVRQNPVKVLDVSGNVAETAPEGSGSYVFSLDHDDHWRVTQIQEAE